VEKSGIESQEACGFVKDHLARAESCPNTGRSTSSSGLCRLGEDKGKKGKAGPAQQGLDEKKGSEIALNTISTSVKEQNK
jgi:hypothetical protein